MPIDQSAPKFKSGRTSISLFGICSCENQFNMFVAVILKQNSTLVNCYLLRGKTVIFVNCKQFPLRAEDSLSRKLLAFCFFVPTFDTKVTEYLCSGWVFFSSDKF